MYPPMIQLVRVTSSTVPGPSSTSSSSSSAVGRSLYVSFTTQTDPTTLLQRDREPCLALDVNGLGVAPGYYNCRLIGSYSNLPLYAVVCVCNENALITTTSNITIPSPGSSILVSVNDTSTLYDGEPVIIVDHTTNKTITGYVFGSPSSSTTFTMTEASIPNGSVGDTLTTGSTVTYATTPPPNLNSGTGSFICRVLCTISAGTLTVEDRSNMLGVVRNSQANYTLTTAANFAQTANSWAFEVGYLVVGTVFNEVSRTTNTLTVQTQSLLDANFSIIIMGKVTPEFQFGGNTAGPSITPSLAGIATNATSLTITGTDFSTTAANDILYLSNGMTLTATSATTTSATFAIPSTLPLGLLTGVLTVSGTSSGASVPIRTVVPAPTVTNTAATQSQDKAATTATITGTGFDPSSPLANTVAFSNGAVGTVTSVNSAGTSMTVTFSTVPTTTGTLSVGVTSFGGKSGSTGTITGATNATPIVVTSISHGLSTGNVVYITDVGGNTNSNGWFTITVTDADHFSLNNSVGNSAYTSGGTWQLLTGIAEITRPFVTQTATSQSNGTTTLTITGTGFSTTPANNTVTTNLGATGTVTSATATSLTVTFSGQPTIGDLAVLVTTNGVPSGQTITGVTNATPVVVTVPNHSLVTGNTVTVYGVTLVGTGTINGNWTITKLSDNTFSLDTSTAQGMFVSGGGITTTSNKITNATNASPIVVTSNSHGLSNGDTVTISGVVGNTGADGTFTVTNSTANTFELYNSTGTGAYASGGSWLRYVKVAEITGTITLAAGTTSYLAQYSGSATIAVIGPEGGAGTSMVAGSGGAGAGGHSQDTFTFASGTSYSCQIPLAKSTKDTWFSSAVTIMAKTGAAGTPGGSGGLGGQAASGFGATKHSGGTGGNGGGPGPTGGGGGGSPGTASANGNNGANAVGPAGGAGGSPYGGAGGASGMPGTPGALGVPGAGSGGSGTGGAPPATPSPGDGSITITR